MNSEVHKLILYTPLPTTKWHESKTQDRKWKFNNPARKMKLQYYTYYLKKKKKYFTRKIMSQKYSLQILLHRFSLINQHFFCERAHMTWRRKKFTYCIIYVRHLESCQNYWKVIELTLDSTKLRSRFATLHNFFIKIHRHWITLFFFSICWSTKILCWLSRSKSLFQYQNKL